MIHDNTYHVQALEKMLDSFLEIPSKAYEDSIIHNNMDLSLKIIPRSKYQANFDIVFNDIDQTNYIYNRKQDDPLIHDKLDDKIPFNSTQEMIFEKVNNNLRDLSSLDTKKRIKSNSKIDELDNEHEKWLFFDHKFLSDNNLISNVSYDILTGDINEFFIDTVPIETKKFSNKSKHHDEPAKQIKSSNIPKTLKRKKILEPIKGLTENEILKLGESLYSICENDKIDMDNEERILSDLLMDSHALDNIKIQENKHTIWKGHYQHLKPKIEDDYHPDIEEDKIRNNYLDFLPSVEQADEKPMDDSLGDEGQEEKTGISTKDSNNDKETTNQIVDILEDKIENLEIPNNLFVPKITETTTPESSQYKWAVQDNTDIGNFNIKLPHNKMAFKYDFELDDFQKRAVLRLENKESVFVAAHTSAGKTVVAEYAIALAHKHMTRAIYTSPIKALSNQKYRDFLNKFQSVGILTGDVSLKPESSCLIVTTEVLRSMLYKGSDIIRDIEWVIFDEVHYVNNAERGVVWEETIIMLPPHIGIIMLSATVPNAMEFANWVGLTKQRKIYVQTTYKRPTPLEHSIYVLNQFQLIKSKDGSFLEKEYQSLIKRIDETKEAQDELRQKRRQDKIEEFKEKDWKFKDKKKEKFELKKKLDLQARSISFTKADISHKRPMDDTQKYRQLIYHCQKEKLLPAVFFAFSKKKCFQIAERLGSLSLCDKDEIGKINRFFNSAVKKLKAVDQELPQLIMLKNLLQRGIAIHNSDLLPICKEIVEILFSEGLIKVLFATETFAMGVNMPAKTVVFCGTKKNDGKDFRYLKSSEYTQMSGRAGRRGLDDKGTVIIFFGDVKHLPPASALKSMVDHKGELLESKFRMTYGTIFNLLLAKDINVIDIMKRSFVEHGKNTALPTQKEKLAALAKEIKLIEAKLNKTKRSPEEPLQVQIYYDKIQMMKELSAKIYTAQRIYEKLNTAKYIMVITKNCEFEIGILKEVNTKDQLKYKCFINQTKSNLTLEQEYLNEIRSQGGMINDGQYGIVDFSPCDIIDIFEEKLPKNLNFDSRNKGDIIQLIQNKRDYFLNATNLKNSFIYSQVHSKDHILMDNYLELVDLKKDIINSPFHKSESKYQQLEDIATIKFKKNEIEAIKKSLDINSLESMNQFEARTKVLKKLGYIDTNDLPLIKARIGRELGSDGIFLCEVIMENVLEDLAPEEIASLLSAFVCQVKSNEEPNLDEIPDTLYEAIEKTKEICKKLIQIEMDNEVMIDDEDTYLKEKLNFSLIKVVYEWANQKDFAEICELTDIQEGLIVSSMLRLDILLRDVKNSCKVMGNMKLHKTIDEASHLIRRDIVFAGSLYLE